VTVRSSAGRIFGPRVRVDYSLRRRDQPVTEKVAFERYITLHNILV
jgi:hypothetical protein